MADEDRGKGTEARVRQRPESEGNVKREAGAEQQAQPAQKRYVGKGVPMGRALLDGVPASPRTFQNLAAVIGGTALVVFLWPDLACSAMFGHKPRDALLVTLFRLLASALSAVAVAVYNLKLGAQENALHLPTARRLSAGLVMWAVCCEAMTILNANLITNFAFGLAALLGAATLLVAGVPAGQAIPRADEPAAAADVLLQTVTSTIQTRVPRALVYAILTSNFIAAGMSYIVTPETTLRAVFHETGGPEGIFLWRCIGSGLLLLAIFTHSLKDAADRQRLGALTHQNLNLALAVAALVHVWQLGVVFAGGSGGPYLPALLSIWTMTLLWSVFNLLAPPPTAPPPTAPPTESGT